jgi:arabinan endo-1,5-alpha-L-arabinosidase
MYHGGGRMVIAAGNRKTGAGHFGRTILDEGVEIMSFHWEADFDQGGRSTLAIHPLLWKNGWPYAGEQVKAGTYAILSERRGYSLELGVDFVRMNVARAGGFGRPQANQAPPQPVAEQTLAQVQGSWPAGDIAVRCSDYMFRPWQKWQLQPTGKGTIAGPLFTIRIEGTNRALTATADLELTTKAYAELDEQLWRVEQLTDGTYRIMPYAIPGQGKNQKYCIYSAGDSTPTLAEYDFKSDNSKWNLRLEK